MGFIKQQKNRRCAAQALSSRRCAGEVTQVILLSGEDDYPMGIPRHLPLCQLHNQLELMVWGIRKFFEVYPSLLASPESGTGNDAWREALAEAEPDPRLYYSLAEDLEFWLNRLSEDDDPAGCHRRPEFEHLRNIAIDLGEAQLTDKQLMAVCMVFNGGVKKKRAAQAMKITSQALADHIKAALKKIEDNIAG